MDRVRAMLRSLLADRFKLEVKEMQFYALQVGKKGGKLKASPPGGQCSLHDELTSGGRNDGKIFSDCPIERLADRIRGNVGGNRPVLDQTGLKGKYDMRLVAVPDYRTEAGGAEGGGRYLLSITSRDRPKTEREDVSCFVPCARSSAVPRCRDQN